MSQLINKYISEQNIENALQQCLSEEHYNIGKLIATVAPKQNTYKFNELKAELLKMIDAVEKDGREIIVAENIIDETNSQIFEESDFDTDNTKDTIKVMMLCNWCESKQLCDLWNKMSKGDYKWNNIEMVWQEPCDYYVVINCPPITVFPNTKKTILFQMEPMMFKNKQLWGDWSNPPPELFYKCCTHNLEYNNNEWHLSKSYNWLMKENISKNQQVASILSTVLSDKYRDPGHIRRIDFVKFLERKGLNVHVYGGNHFEWKNYKGSLPYHQKDDAMFPYKYVFNAENYEYRNYFTEKLVDGILAECLVFYWGCPNIRDFFDEKALVQLDLDDFEKDYQTITNAIEENWWEQRLPYIKKAKQKILTELQFFPRLEKILQKNQN